MFSLVSALIITDAAVRDNYCTPIPMPSNRHPVWPNPILRVRLCPCLLQASNKEEQYGEQVRILGAKHKEVRTQHHIDIT